MADETQVELVVAGQEQRRIDRDAHGLPPGVGAGERHGINHFTVKHHDELAHIVQHRGRPGHLQPQDSLGNRAILAHAERDADFAFRALQADRARDAQILERHALRKTVPGRLRLGRGLSACGMSLGRAQHQHGGAKRGDTCNRRSFCKSGQRVLACFLVLGRFG